MYGRSVVAADSQQTKPWRFWKQHGSCKGGKFRRLMTPGLLFGEMSSYEQMKVLEGFGRYYGLYWHGEACHLDTERCVRLPLGGGVVGDSQWQHG